MRGLSIGETTHHQKKHGKADKFIENSMENNEDNMIENWKKAVNMVNRGV